MAINSVTDLLTATRKITLDVGVKEDSDVTLAYALDYYRTQVNTLQAENPD